MKRSHGSGHLYVKWGSYYVRWRTPDGSFRSRRLGNVRVRGEKGGLSKAEAERAARQMVGGSAAETSAPEPKTRSPTSTSVAEELARDLWARSRWTVIEPMEDSAPDRRFALEIPSRTIR
jgi:hypothetical protein